MVALSKTARRVKSTKSRKNLFVAGFIGEINMFNATVIERLDEQRVRANVEGRECNIYVNFAVEPGQKTACSAAPGRLTC